MQQQYRVLGVAAEHVAQSGDAVSAIAAYADADETVGVVDADVVVVDGGTEGRAGGSVELAG